MIGYIYLNTDLKNGKQYTGQHHYYKEELDPNYHGSGVLWTNVLKKRPKELIKEEYIKTCYSQEELNESEKYYTKLFNTLYPNGYNLTEGGEGGVPCEETRKKISETKKGCIAWNKGKHQTEETKKKISEKHKGRTPVNKGKHHTEEARKKMSEAKIGFKKTDECIDKWRKKMINGKLSKKVLQFSKTGELIREWISVSEVERQLGFKQGAISMCCRGERKFAYNFIWKYKEVV